MLSTLVTVPPSHFALGAVVCLVLYQVYLYLTLGATRRKFSKKHGCQPPPAYSHKDPILGTDLALKIAKAGKAQTFLESVQDRFRTYGNTYSMKLMGRNSKCISA